MHAAPRKHSTAVLTSSDHCGCAMSARFLGVTLIASMSWFAWHWKDYSLGRAGLRILLIAFAGAILGKLVGLALYRLLGKR
jgi:hypothetical protein